MKWKFFVFSALIFSAFQLQQANAQQQVRLTFENLQPDTGFFLTPVFAGFHDGTFDVFNPGEAASNALELLAEDGIINNTDPDGLQQVFAAAQPTGRQSIFGNPAGPAPIPVLDPGESVSQVFSLDNNSRFLNYATMVIPTNDLFLGNPEAIEILDAAGAFLGDQSFDLTGENIWDAGTEVNDGEGAAFSNGRDSTPEAQNIALIGPDNFSNDYDGIGRVIGGNSFFDGAADTPFLRVTISAVPEPSSLALLGAFSLVGVLRRRR